MRLSILGNAWYVFGKMEERYVFSWNVFVGGYAKGGYFDEALNLMLLSCISNVGICTVFDKMSKRERISWNAMIVVEVPDGGQKVGGVFNSYFKRL